jgi:hypothetical protein
VRRLPPHASGHDRCKSADPRSALRVLAVFFTPRKAVSADCPNGLNAVFGDSVQFFIVPLREGRSAKAGSHRLGEPG